MKILNSKDYLTDDFPIVSKNNSSIEITNYQNKIGFTIFKKETSFSHNTFAKFFCKHVKVVLTANKSEFALYNVKKGVYELNCQHEISAIIKFIMNQCEDLWTPAYERLAIEAIRRDILVSVDDFNNGDYINLQDGILELSTYKLKPHSADYYTTIKLPFSYKTNCETPIFNKYLDDICCGDEQLKILLQEIAGYCLCNSTKAEKAFFLLGNGCNGKSVFAKLLQALVGNGNCSTTSLSALNGTFGLASLVNSNINIAAENSTDKINSEIFKAIVSGDTVEVNRKYKEAISVSLHTKLVFLFNSLPYNNDLSYGFFRKLIIVPFNRTFTGSEIDVNLFEKLQTELSGIFHWAIKGLKRLRSNNYVFSECSASTNCLMTYKRTLNPVADFFDDTVYINCAAKVKKSEIFDYYIAFCTRNRIATLSNKRFWDCFKSHIEDKKLSFVIKRINGYDYISGIAIKEEIKNLEIN